ncbi:hypothetical protein [Gandjariella thermophila]|uniref:Uncharacterized protein n=1 Tax=Gandjariella thermophila TaxID=1931992 RepID=A0A4D4JBQ2_9PSEU|nr:hypothetical protein [Gandjariella thermophila]GDY31283.1 hypothetical protein GTS_29160 [Gandjariella thermophila]
MRKFILGSVAAAAALLLAPAVAEAATPVHYPAPAPVSTGTAYPASFPGYYPSYTPGCSFTPHHLYSGEGIRAFCESGPGWDYRVVARCGNTRTEWLEFGEIVPIGRDSSSVQCRGSDFDPGHVLDYRVDFF